MRIPSGPSARRRLERLEVAANMGTEPDALTALRLQLHQGGYHSVPVSSPEVRGKSAGKRPLMENWAAACATATKDDVAQWSITQPNCTNTGLLCGSLVGVDIDVKDEALAADIEALVVKRLGATAYRRVGQWPKTLLAYRTDEPFAKLQTPALFFDDGSKTQIEVLGTGQQFVAFGRHPDTSKDYSWTDASPLDAPLSALPAVNKAVVASMLKDAEVLLRQAGGRTIAERIRRDRDGRAAAGLGLEERPDRLTIAEALAYVPNLDLDYDGWIRIGFALHDGLGAAGLEVWAEWSAQSTKDDPAATRRKWSSFGQSHANKITVGTLFWEARQNGWRTRVRQPIDVQERDAEPANDDRPRLLVEASDPDKTVEAMREILAASGVLFDRAVPVKVAHDQMRRGVAIQVMSPDALVLLMHRLARPYSIRTDKDGVVTERNVRLPRSYAVMYLDWRGEWGLPVLNGIASTPMLRDDGSIYSVEGYDPASGMWCEHLPDISLDVPGRPTRTQAEASLHVIRATFRTFCFADAPLTGAAASGQAVVDLDQPPGADESAFLAALLTAICRPSLQLAPGVLIRAASMSGAGAGKGLLARCISLIAFGREPHAVTGGSSKEELEKRIAAELLEGGPTVFLDNLNNVAFRSDLLASAITERPARVRILGKSQMAPLNAAALIILTGNGLTVSEDLARRFLTIELDPGTEDPEARSFNGDIRTEVRQRREELLTAALTIWRWGRMTGGLEAGRALGSFEEWCRWVRDPLIALGCQDPAARVSEVKRRDGQREAIAEIFAIWWDKHRDRSLALRDLDQGVRDAADPQGRGRQYLAARIARLEGTRMSGFVLNRQQAAGHWGAATYRLQATAGASDERSVSDGASVAPLAEGHRDHRGHAAETDAETSVAPYAPYAYDDDESSNPVTVQQWSADH